ncbi:MAG: Spo0E family sporulation regulatory protein-aspartic acid phosphatase [Bacillus sp. (in: firmicutes)]
MLTSVCQLTEEIEQTRERMIMLASHTSIDNQDVITISMELDQLVNKYIGLTRKK